ATAPASGVSATSTLAVARPAGVAYRAAFLALLTRDVIVVRKQWKSFLVRTLMQPLLLVFVFTYVFPKIGQGIGGAANADRFSTLLVAGVLGLAIIFQGIQAVALPMVQEFGYSKEIEDRVLAPLPVELVAIQKIVSGVIQGLLAAVLVFPIAALVPATPVHLHINWIVLLTIAPLAGWTASALGLALGTTFPPTQVPLLFSVIVMPLTFLGAVYFPWSQLSSIRWVQVLTLIDPLVYMNEGFRSAVTPAQHMSLWAVYGMLLVFATVFTVVGVRNFRGKVIS
ncbi:MAG: ABC-type polysaccharide/polyol phosphate export system, permease component, partial [Acidimicrobiia bacterium]|nr:ABC-type polysaccharide/polyol phosphate export system, permease component [Acidimicrobiia bacterium]